MKPGLMKLTALTGMICLSVIPATTGAAPDEELADQAYAVLKKHCVRCHGETFEHPGLDVLDRRALIEGKYIVPGDLEKSGLWERAGVNRDMPPENVALRPSNAELDLLKKWIGAGAEFPALDGGERPFVSVREDMRQIRDSLNSFPERDRKFQRYFTLTNLNNNPRGVTNDEYRLYQAALSKALNSLSWQPRIVTPVAVDEARTLFRIDLRDYGWEEQNLWQLILSAYPYGLVFDGSADAELVEFARDVYQQSGSRVPAIRADWFISHALRPDTTTSGLYHRLLGLPKTDAELEKQLRVDVQRNFRLDRLARAGFATSGVSQQNRMVERHDAAFGSYWKSYDFKPNVKRGDLFRFPLGPEFEGNGFGKQAFVHDGGEMIFSLPNGLHGYFLTDGKGQRIDAGPIDVVSDSLKTSGTPVIVNGLSCIACHKVGVKKWAPQENTIREGTGVAGDALQKVRALYPEPDEMQRLLNADDEDYLRALEQTIGPFLRENGDDRPISAYAEPVGMIARRYLRDPGPDEIAAELGFENAAALQQMIKLNPDLRSLGLGPLANGGKIKREQWENRRQAVSMFHLTALEIKLGTPSVTFAAPDRSSN